MMNFRMLFSPGWYQHPRPRRKSMGISGAWRSLVVPSGSARPIFRGDERTVAQRSGKNFDWPTQSFGPPINPQWVRSMGRFFDSTLLGEDPASDPHRHQHVKRGALLVLADQCRRAGIG